MRKVFFYLFWWLFSESINICFYCAVCTISNIINGFPSRSGSLNTGETVTYTCETSYVLRGAAVLTCLIDGTFSAETPSCVLGKPFL